MTGVRNPYGISYPYRSGHASGEKVGSIPTQKALAISYQGE